MKRMENRGLTYYPPKVFHSSQTHPHQDPNSYIIFYLSLTFICLFFFLIFCYVLECMHEHDCGCLCEREIPAGISTSNSINPCELPHQTFNICKLNKLLSNFWIVLALPLPSKIQPPSKLEFLTSSPGVAVHPRRLIDCDMVSPITLWTKRDYGKVVRWKMHYILYVSMEVKTMNVNIKTVI